MVSKRTWLSPLLLLCLTACSTMQPVAYDKNGTATPLALPATWTPSPTLPPRNTPTPFPTYTTVPAFTRVVTHTPDPLHDLAQQFESRLYSRDGQWVANYESGDLKVIHESTGKTWTLPCALFQVCGFVIPVHWTADSQVLYFAPEAVVFEAPIGVSLYTAVARINVETGKWTTVLPETNRSYDFAVSHDDEYLAYTQPAGDFSENKGIVLTIRNLQNDREKAFSLDGFVAGNILWSPFKHRFVFQTEDIEAATSIVYYDVDEDLLKYLVKNEKLLILDAWREDNLVYLQKIGPEDREITHWVLNPFTNELYPATSTP